MLDTFFSLFGLESSNKLTLPLPGVKSSDLEVLCKKNKLLVKVKKSLLYSWTLSQVIDKEKTRVTYSNGLLEVYIIFTDDPEETKLTINVS